MIEYLREQRCPDCYRLLPWCDCEPADDEVRSFRVDWPLALAYALVWLAVAVQR